MKGKLRPVILTAVETGRFYTFRSLRQASEFLGRSELYTKSRIAGKPNGEILTSKHGLNYTAKMIEVAEVAPRPVEEKKRTEGHTEQMYHNHKTQLCQTCARASGFCEWSKHLKPVEGWTAEPTLVKHLQRNGSGKVVSIEVESYHITGCPLYMEDGKTVEERRKQRKMLMEELVNEGTGSL